MARTKKVINSFNSYIREELNYPQKGITALTILRNLKLKGFETCGQLENTRPNRGKYLRIIKGLRLKSGFEDISDRDSALDFRG
ncbi:P4 family phage/plasmid primase [Candidatus Liberibacter africanus PTSAPSY]|uniref:p4 family phage/plasmid primase n=1 Tax=Candidatus Liberibacter africanus PTSAPSY TaxID=1277257 RepID=A0A0G3I1I1_LIBAF|nr:P4 family phage/plasmid primase [Candidatus Liberibacter africanus PTSAPSY]